MPGDSAPTLEPLADGTGFRVRIRIPTTDEALAEKRAAVLVALGAELANVPAELAASLLQQAGAADGPGLMRIKAAVAKLASGAVKVKRREEQPRAAWSVRELREAWTKGTLAKEYPDQIKARRAVSSDISRLERHVYPIIGDIRVSALTLADVERVMASLTGKRPTERKLSAHNRAHAKPASKLECVSAQAPRVEPDP